MEGGDQIGVFELRGANIAIGIYCSKRYLDLDRGCKSCRACSCGILFWPRIWIPPLQIPDSESSSATSYVLLNLFIMDGVNVVAPL